MIGRRVVLADGSAWGTGERVRLKGTHRAGEIVTEAPRSSLSQRRLLAVHFDGEPSLLLRYHTAEELLPIREPARKVAR